MSMKSFSEFCKEYLCERLDEYGGDNMYACDMAYILCGRASCDGTMHIAEQKQLNIYTSGGMMLPTIQNTNK